MSVEGASSRRVTVTFPSLLFLVFLVLRLTGVIGWSWWWVTAPLWAPFALAFVMVFTGTLLSRLAERP